MFAKKSLLLLARVWGNAFVALWYLLYTISFLHQDIALNLPAEFEKKVRLLALPYG